MHISVKELWDAWLRSEVHNWTIEQTTDWLAQSVQLPQYVDLFKQHKVTGAALPRYVIILYWVDILSKVVSLSRWEPIKAIISYELKL